MDKFLRSLALLLACILFSPFLIPFMIFVALLHGVNPEDE